MMLVSFRNLPCDLPRSILSLHSHFVPAFYVVPELCSSVTLVETMGLPKANELLLLGKRIDAHTALSWNLCSQVVSGCDTSGDPFHPDSLAGKMANEIHQRLLSLPLGDRTSRVFVSMVRGRRKARLEEVCRNELIRLDERFNDGECLEAAMQLSIGSKKTQSKL
jgi:peroxisomal 3,2-trans-enoyl-CoA isomerase